MRSAVVVLCAVWWAEVVGGKVRAPPLPWRERRDVSTTQGTVRGYLGNRHFAFLGIPYASPPTKSDRFKAPEPPPSWDGVFEATHRVVCPQHARAGDENCLVVNVFVTQQASDPRPVMVLVHDGGYHSGWGELQPPMRFIDDFVVVTVNYRLGVFGFLCLGTPEAPGNAGLKDQVAALYWIQQNIANFGGDPSDVSVYGIGAGAISIQLLLLSGLTKGLIHKAILDSGSVLSPSAMSHNPFSKALDLAVSIGYNDTGNTDHLVKFYQKQSVKDLITISRNFLPCVENSFLYAHSLIDQDPKDILMKGNFEKIPLMVVYTISQEVQLVDQNSDKFTEIPEVFDDLLPTNLDFRNDATKIKMAELVKDFYFDEYGDIDTKKITNSYKEYINDVFMEYPIYKFSIMYASKSPSVVYVMRFGHERTADSSSGYGEIFRYINAKDLPDEQVTTANRLVALFTNFMKISDPTPLITELVPLVWEPLNSHGPESVNIDRPCLLFGSSLTMAQPPASQQINFWDYIYTKYSKKHSFDGFEK